MVAECEGIVHLAPESRQRWMLAPSGFPHLMWTPVYGMVFSHSGWIIPPKLTLSETPPQTHSEVCLIVQVQSENDPHVTYSW